MRETIDHMRGRLAGLADALGIVYDLTKFDLLDDAFIPVVREVRLNLCRAIHNAKSGVLKDIRLAKAKAAKGGAS